MKNQEFSRKNNEFRTAPLKYVSLSANRVQVGKDSYALSYKSGLCLYFEEF